MTRTHAARQLLALGPLSFGEFVIITGWPIPACRRVLSYLVDDLGELDRHRGIYRIEDGKQLPDVPALEAPREQGNGETPIRPLRVEAALGVSAALADVREAQAGCCRRCSREGCMGGEGVSADEALLMTYGVRA